MYMCVCYRGTYTLHYFSACLFQLVLCNVTCFIENTIVVCSHNADNVSVISKPVTTAVYEICTGLYFTEYVCMHWGVALSSLEGRKWHCPVNEANLIRWNHCYNKLYILLPTYIQCTCTCICTYMHFWKWTSLLMLVWCVTLTENGVPLHSDLSLADDPKQKTEVKEHEERTDTAIAPPLNTQVKGQHEW